MGTVQYTQDLQTFTPDTKPGPEKGSGHEVPSLAKKLLTISTCWEMEKHFCPVDSHWVYRRPQGRL